MTVAKAIAYKAGEIMRHYFYGNQQREIKADGSPLTIADTTINTFVIEQLAKEFPKDIVIGEEESTGDYGIGRRWFCDPVDGTKAFTWGVPTAMFSLGLVIDGVPQLGVCYEPMLDKLYWAQKGGGAFCNEIPIKVNVETLENGILATISSPYRIRNQAPYFDSLLKDGVEMAVFSGAVAKSAGVADGRFVGYIEELAGAHDMAAIQVVVEEAGGIVTMLDGTPIDYTKPFNGVAVSNSTIHSQLIDVLTSTAI